MPTSVAAMAVLATALAVLPSACRGPSTEPGADVLAPVPAVVVVVTPANPDLTGVGATLQLTAQARDAAGRNMSGLTFSWRSSDTTTVVVSASGLVTSVGYGSASITATTGGVSGNTTVAVAPMEGGLASVTAGARHTCGVTTTGRGYCWGDDTFNQLGIGGPTLGAGSPDPFSDSVPHSSPMAIAGGLRFATVSAGTVYTCGVTTDGAGFCWGYNALGQLGIRGYVPGSNQIRNLPLAVAGGLPLRSVSAGDGHTCGVTTAGTAYCWGDNRTGELGTGTFGDCCSPESVPVSGGLTMLSVSAGMWHTCAVATTGAAYCWGGNLKGQLGTTEALGLCDFSEPCTAVPVPVAGGLTFVSVSAGYFFACGITDGGAAYCWGDNDAGQLGDGTTASRAMPVPVSSGLTFRSLSVGAYHACGITAAGAAYCWGDNSNGQLGSTQAVGQSNVPVPVAGGLTFVSISSGASNRASGGHTCALAASGVAYCWGLNDRGQLGDGTTSDRATPVRVLGQ